MIKYAGIFIIFFSSVMFGVYLVERLSCRINILRSTSEMLMLFKREISYSMPTLSELFAMCGELRLAEFTESAAKLLGDGKSLEESISDSMIKANCLSQLTREEKAALTDILSSLGTTDADGQISILENGIERFSDFLNKAVEDKKKNAKVYMSVSVYIGLAAAILFF